MQESLSTIPRKQIDLTHLTATDINYEWSDIGGEETEAEI